MIRSIALILLLSSLCSPQTKSGASSAGKAGAQTFSLGKVRASGSKRFPEGDIVKATGLKPGATVTGDDLKQAASRLAQCGVFKEVRFSFDGVSADYAVVDADQLVPATFENFVWFSDAELAQRVHGSVPLFNGNVPLTGDLPDQISAVLDSILKQKGIPGHATSMMQGTLAGQLQTLQFKIDGIDAKITEIRFPGSAPERTPLLQAASKLLVGEDYLRSTVAETINRNAPSVYGKLGFLKAQFGSPKPVILKDDAKQPVVAVEVPVQEGDQYTFAALSWTGAIMVPTPELAKGIDLKPGAPADTTQLAKGIAAVKQLYGAKGYMYAQVRSTATLDTEKHTATFNLEVKEGPLYHMGKLEIQGLEPQRAQLVQKVWELHPGDVYDASYPPSFLKNHPRELSALNGWAARFTQTIHDDTHVVDLSVKFDKFQREAK